MKITIHRGTHQIGGCVTEISSRNSKAFIDFGADLPGVVSAEPIKKIAGLTESDGSNSALFFTHYHGDHVGRLCEIKTEIPIYMGKTAKELYKNYAVRTNSEIIEKIDTIRTFSSLQKITVGNITVTPLMIDHSAFDAYMFIIDADGKRVLHTGDFRLHGFRGNKTLPMVQKYATDIDIIICETMDLIQRNIQVLLHFLEKTIIFDSDLSDIIKTLQVQREDSDYNIIAEFNIDDAKEAYEKAKLFVSTIEKHLDKK